MYVPQPVYKGGCGGLEASDKTPNRSLFFWGRGAAAITAAYGGNEAPARHTGYFYGAMDRMKSSDILLKRYLQSGLLLLLALLVASCSPGKAEKRAVPAIPVSTGKSALKNVPFQIRSIGNVEAYNTVSVKAQVNGELIKVYVKEGQYVNKGDMLFKIDPRSFEASLKQAEANLARDRALAKKANDDVERYAFLIQKGYVARQEFDQVKSNAEALNATARADVAVVDNNRVQLEYTNIRSPINGQVSNNLVNAGNVVKANDAALTSINQINPIFVTFTVPEVYLAEIKKYMTGGKLKIVATVPGQEQNPETGILSSLDNTVDKATGTIRMKGTFDNKGRRLWPGQFVNVVLDLYVQNNAVVVPSPAVLSGQSGQYVYVVRNDLTVELRNVDISRTYGGETVIAKGLKEGEQVVTDGQLLLTNGSKIQIKPAIKTENGNNGSPSEVPANKETHK
jgi:multidrug efflux system membrane fusion protein